MVMQSNDGGRNNTNQGQGPSPEAAEGQMLAHRKVLVLLIREMQRRGDATDLLSAIESLSVMQDHQEDPGAVPDAAVAIQGALAEEIGLIHRACAASAPPV